MSDFRRKSVESFDVENRRNWGNYREFLHPQVEWIPEEDVIKGCERYCETIVAVYVQSVFRFRMHQMPESEDGRRIATLLADTDGRCSLDIFEFEDGLIRRKREHLLGCDADWNGRSLSYGRGQEDADEIPLRQGAWQLGMAPVGAPVIQMNAFTDIRSIAPAMQIVQVVGVGKSGCVICNDEVSYDADQLPSRDETRALYDSVGWVAYTDDLDVPIRGLENSAAVVTAWSGGELIGLVRIVSDRVTIAYLQDVLVHPPLQRRGIATALVNRAFALFSRVRQHVLLTDAEPGQRAFYESIDFTEARNFPRQGCRLFVRFNP